MTIPHHIAAGIDLGSNTFRLLVADCSAGGLTTLAKKLATVRLGRGLAANELLHEKAVRRGIRVLRDFRQVLDRYRPQYLRICGTEALRRAPNSHLFLRPAAEILPQAIEIITGAEEARLCFAGALAGSRESAAPLLLIDVGGCSTELIFREFPGAEPRVASVPLGVVGLTEKFFNGPAPDIGSLNRLLTDTFEAPCARLTPCGTIRPLTVIGCGGTATSMAALDLKLQAYDESLVHGHVLRQGAMELLWRQLIPMPADQRNAMPGLGDGRGEILPAGIRIYLKLLTLLQQDRLQVSDTGLLEGILLSGLPAGGVPEPGRRPPQESG